jgi:hypothetical protein
VAHHGDETEPGVGHVHVPVLSLRRPVNPAHELREDSPGLHAADHVDAHVAVERRPDVVRTHRGGDGDGGGFVSAPGVEASGDLPLLVENVAAFLDAAGRDECPEDAEQVLAVEAQFLQLAQRADGLCFPGDRHEPQTL